MNRRGVCYDVGHVMGINWRPVFDMAVVHRELEIIHGDLHCNAVRIGGRDLKRVVRASEDALAQGLEVWFSPVLWDKSPGQTFAYIVAAAEAAEKLRLRRPDRLVFVVGSELTLFMQGIVPGKSLVARMRNPAPWSTSRWAFTPYRSSDGWCDRDSTASTCAMRYSKPGNLPRPSRSWMRPGSTAPSSAHSCPRSTPTTRTLDTISTWPPQPWSRPWARGRHGTTYPDVPWEPKASFWAVGLLHAPELGLARTVT